MNHVAKPRCRYVLNDSGEPVAWLVHGTGCKAYSIQSIDHAISNWFAMVMNRVLAGATA